MFASDDRPRIFGLPPGVDLAAALAAGLRERAAGAPPEALARATVYLTTARMRRRVRAAFDAGPPALLPRLRLVTEIGAGPLPGVPPAVPPLRRRLELAQLVAKLLAREPGLAPATAAYDLAESLAALIDEMHGEGVPLDALDALHGREVSVHWQRSLAFLRIAAGYAAATGQPEPEARQRMAVERLVASWDVAPPAAPVIVAGSTGSRGTTALLMAAVARLPRGALLLPGFDFDLPPAVWSRLDDAMTGEDHPQFRFARLLGRIGVGPEAVRPWGPAAPCPPRNRLLSLALRPAPATDAWRLEGPALGELAPATAGITLIEAPSARAEAVSIALCLREAAETGRRAALVTPDRQLARGVTAALDRWRIGPDDSAGRPLALSAPGRFLRQVAATFLGPVTGEALLALLKHPLCSTGRAERGPHLRTTRELELFLRRGGPPHPDPATLRAFAEGREERSAWAAWVTSCLEGGPAWPLPVAERVERLLARAEALARGPVAATGASGDGAPVEAADRGCLPPDPRESSESKEAAGEVPSGRAAGSLAEAPGGAAGGLQDKSGERGEREPYQGRELKVGAGRDGTSYAGAAASRPGESGAGALWDWARRNAAPVEAGRSQDGALPPGAEHGRGATWPGQGAEPATLSAAGTLWEEAAGRAARERVEELRVEAPHGGAVTAAEFAAILHATLEGEVREAEPTHPDVLILGTLEARTLDAELVILGGLNEGVWPEAPAPDPWLNRGMRHAAGLLLPERRIGLSAHDFQQAVAGPEVVLTRAVRGASADTVPSRWLARLVNLLEGLSAGRPALRSMRERGALWLDRARALETAERVNAAPRPSPRPPVAHRPTALSVTQIATLVRDPYAVYAREVLGLRRLDPLRPEAGAPMRGSVLHAVLERFGERPWCGDPEAARAALLSTAEEVLGERVPWPAVRRLWFARLARVADWFVAGEAARRARGAPVLVERQGEITVDGFTLRARPDRIDRLANGSLAILDYKTGKPPKPKQIVLFDKQLLLEAVMAERGAFPDIPPAAVAEVAYIGLGTEPAEERLALAGPDAATSTAQVLDEFRRLVAAWREPSQGYTSRMAPALLSYDGDFDHLARYGEWDQADLPQGREVG